MLSWRGWARYGLAVSAMNKKKRWNGEALQLLSRALLVRADGLGKWPKRRSSIPRDPQQAHAGAAFWIPFPSFTAVPRVDGGAVEVPSSVVATKTSHSPAHEPSSCLTIQTVEGGGGEPFAMDKRHPIISIGS